YRALRAGRFPPIRDLSFAFTHARTGDDMMAAYFGASRVVTYLDERFGFPALVAMLREWGRGRSTEEVFRRALHTSIDYVHPDLPVSELARMARLSGDFAIDRSGAGDLDSLRTSARLDAHSAAAQGALAAAELASGHGTEALAAAQAAIALD